MRACATANVICLGLALGAFSFAACSSGQSPPPPAPTGQDPGAPPGPAASPTAAAAQQDAPGAAATTAPAAKGPPQSEITNEPKGGVALNNAQPSADGGPSDRLQPLIDVVKNNRDGFRQCFDIWGKKNPRQSGSVYLVFKLKPDGALEKVEVDPSKGNLHAAEVEDCMINFAKTLTYPKSPSGKETKFTYPFDFKAK